MNMLSDNHSDISPAPVDHLNQWIAAAYSGAGSVTSKYANLVFTPEAESRVQQIAGWFVGLVHGGRKDLAEQAAEDINRRFMYLNEYGGNVEDTFGDGTPVVGVPRYKVRLGDDRTFGGFTLGWHRAVRGGSERDGDRSSFLRNRWDSLVDHPRWGQDAAGEREMVTHYYGFDFHGGLVYHGPGGGETFSVSIGEVSFWGIHT